MKGGVSSKSISARANPLRTRRRRRHINHRITMKPLSTPVVFGMVNNIIMNNGRNATRRNATRRNATRRMKKNIRKSIREINKSKTAKSLLSSLVTELIIEPSNSQNIYPDEEYDSIMNKLKRKVASQDIKGIVRQLQKLSVYHYGEEEKHIIPMMFVENARAAAEQMRNTQNSSNINSLISMINSIQLKA